MNHSEMAKNNFLKGYNCAQSIVLAFSDYTGLDEKESLRIASSFGGGMGRLREVCGAFSGALIVLGIVKGYDQIDDTQKNEHYVRVQKIGERFEKDNGSLYCRDIIKLDHHRDDPQASKRTTSYYEKRVCCVKAIENSAIALEEMLNE